VTALVVADDAESASREPLRDVTVAIAVLPEPVHDEDRATSSLGCPLQQMEGGPIGCVNRSRE
jgi:hypothetical protein